MWFCTAIAVSFRTNRWKVAAQAWRPVVALTSVQVVGHKSRDPPQAKVYAYWRQK
jgi:hypothetical protein